MLAAVGERILDVTFAQSRVIQMHHRIAFNAEHTGERPAEAAGIHQRRRMTGRSGRFCDIRRGKGSSLTAQRRDKCDFLSQIPSPARRLQHKRAITKTLNPIAK